MPPPSRREQLELDELLSDIFKGIETLPDKSAHSNRLYSGTVAQSQPQAAGSSSEFPNSDLFAHSYLKEYELPASSPLVKQHKQELAALKSSSNNKSLSQPQRSTLKRHTNTPEQPAQNQQPSQQQQQQQPQPQVRQHQSLASFVTSTTPENKRRVRIVDHPDKLAKGDEDYNTSKRLGGNVKYVNTNKLIYHQERDPDDEAFNSDSDNANTNNHEEEEDEDIDGVTRVEYYHTTWLDRQLGRASKRRSSKELNERQVKEKAMIEELKRSLKNGAITLRQSFKGKRNSNKTKPSETYDDQILDSVPKHKEARSVFGSGLATIPRNYHQNNSGRDTHTHSHSQSQSQNQSNRNGIKSPNLNNNANKLDRHQSKSNSQKQAATNYNSTQAVTPTALTTPMQTYTSGNTHLFDSVYKPESVQTPSTVHLDSSPQAAATNYSRTLPHNYNNQKRGEHQLLQSHYRGDKNFNTIGNNSRLAANSSINSSPSANTYTNNKNNFDSNSNNMRTPLYSSNYAAKSPTHNSNYCEPQLSKLHQNPPPASGNTISSIPSATEVVRSALSRSSSQVSLNQLNKTINLLPNSPPPYAPSPSTPTQQLKAASPSLSPSPNRPSPNTHYPYTSKTMGYQQHQHQHQPNQLVVSGTRTIGRPPQVQQQSHQTNMLQQQQQQQQQHQQQHQQPVYANPHSSLMQHRVEQQMKQPGRTNNASIREFNELDSLLRSLSPGATTHITPGFTSKPSQPSFGYGFTPAQQQQQYTPTGRPTQPASDMYAKVQRQPTAGIYVAPNKQQHQQSYGSAGANLNQPNNTQQQTQPFTIDVTNKKDDNCLHRQDLSEFEPPMELLPSMEDYQNISKLNPVRNHYWYKPNMSRDMAISLLKDKPQGTFIVRDSTSFRGAYGLAVKVSKLPKNVLNNASLRNPNGDPSSELIRHFLIEPTSNGVRLKGYANEPVFSTLPNLIYQHSLFELALPCKLVIPRADIEDPKFNHKQKQFYDEFIASKEQAKHSPYDRTSPNGGYRKYPGDVYVHNEHRIIFQ